MIHNIDLSQITAQQVEAVRPDGGFDIIYADPPWKFASNSAKKPGRNPMRHYECMATDAICAMPVPALAAKDALLLLWATSPMLEHALRVVAAWGFRYKSQLVWPKSHAGTGFWVRNQHEVVILAKRGNFLCGRPAPFATSIIAGQTREHSRKPNEWLGQIEARYPAARKLELFARAPREGWTVMGNQVDMFQEGK